METETQTHIPHSNHQDMNYEIMTTVIEGVLFDLPLFQTIIEFLDVPSALQLRGTCRNCREACSTTELSTWRHDVVLPVLRQVHGALPCHPRGYWFQAPLMNDTHLSWLFDNSSDVESVDLANAPFPTNALLQKIASECPNLKSFSVRRGQDMLRLYFHEALTGLTSAGVVALLDACPRLEFLCLSWCESVDGDAVCEAIRQSPVHLTLKHLDLDGVQTSDAAIISLSACSGLQTLKMKDTSAFDISPLASCTQIETLHLCRGRHILPESIVSACEGFGESIRVLCCMGCRNIDEATALWVLDICPQLQVWNCVRGTAVSPPSARTLRRRSYETGRDVRFDFTNAC